MSDSVGTDLARRMNHGTGMWRFIPNVILLVTQVLYLFSPVLASAALAALVMRFDLLSSLRRPIDGGAMFRGQRLLGNGKTWRGVVVAVAGCVATVVVQTHVIGQRAAGIALVHYEQIDPVVFGSGMAIAAMSGELPNSFVKRRLGIGAGKTSRGTAALVFYVWDQIDLLMFTWPFLSCWLQPTSSLIIVSVILAMLLHPTFSLLGYLLGARRTAR